MQNSVSKVINETLINIDSYKSSTGNFIIRNVSKSFFLVQLYRLMLEICEINS